MSWPLSRSFYLLCRQKGYFHPLPLIVGILSPLISFVIMLIYLVLLILYSNVDRQIDRQTNSLTPSIYMYVDFFFQLYLPTPYSLRSQGDKRSLWSVTVSYFYIWIDSKVSQLGLFRSINLMQSESFKYNVKYSQS